VVSVAPAFVASGNPSPSHMAFAGMWLALLGCFAFGTGRRGDSQRGNGVMAILVLALLLAGIGCASSGSPVTPTPRKSTPVKVMATTQGTGAAQQLNLTLNIEP